MSYTVGQPFVTTGLVYAEFDTESGTPCAYTVTTDSDLVTVVDNRLEKQLQLESIGETVAFDLTIIIAIVGNENSEWRYTIPCVVNTTEPIVTSYYNVPTPPSMPPLSNVITLEYSEGDIFGTENEETTFIVPVKMYQLSRLEIYHNTKQISGFQAWWRPPSNSRGW